MKKQKTTKSAPKLDKGNRKKEKTNLHPRNKHRSRYDFGQLIASCPDLAPFVTPNKYGDESINFADPKAVIMLNKALLKHFYGIEHWSIPADYLTPPIPGRANYIHYMADLLASKNYGKMPIGPQIKCLDIGVGANCIYPIIGTIEYGWSFIGSDTDPKAIESAGKIVELNPSIRRNIELKLQTESDDFFYNIIDKNQHIDLTICNPPFHASLAEAHAGTLRKVKNLSKKKVKDPVKNFGGQSNELWCEGGEKRFVSKMIRESKKFSASCYWFSSLISKESNLNSAYRTLEKVEVAEVKTIPMGQGNKKSRIVAWTFFSPEQQKMWAEKRWSE